MVIKTTNRVERPKDYSKIVGRSDSYGGDIQEATLIQATQTEEYVGDMVEYEDSYNANINNGASATLTLTAEGNNVIKEFELVNASTPANASTTPIEIYVNGTLVYTLPNLYAFGNGTLPYKEVIDYFTDKIERDGDVYEVVINNNSGNAWVYTFYFRRRVLIL